jgi:hypothetical protein
MPQARPQPAAPAPAIAGGKIDRQEIAAIVDRFLAGKQIETPAAPASPLPKPEIEAEAGSMYTGPSVKVTEPVSRPAPAPSPSTNGNKAAVDFVSEDDVKRAIQKGDKIYINSKTIITPAARDIGEPAEVFAKV